MANEINIDVFTVTVLNESDGLIVIIDLKNVWEFLIPHSFLHVQCSLSVPTLDKGIASTIQLSLQETFEIKNISAFEKISQSDQCSPRNPRFLSNVIRHSLYFML